MGTTWTSSFKRHLWRAFAAIAFVAIGLPAGAKTIAYVPETLDARGAYVVEWNAAGRARVVDWRGARSGTVTDYGTQKLVTLDVPIAYESYSADQCDGVQYLQRYETYHVVFRQAEGTPSVGKTDVVEIGVVVDVDGCTPGKVTPFGSLTDAGTRWLNRSYGSRPPMTDVQSGFSIAGFSESQVSANDFAYEGPADVVTLDTPTRLRFHTTGTVVDAALNSEQWLLLQMPGFQRGYTRFNVHGPSTTEIWLMGEFADGKLQNVRMAPMVKPVAGTSFGTLGQTARMWESMFFIGTDFPFFIYLYRNHNGDRVFKDLVYGDESRTPITWQYQGTNIVQSRYTGTTRRERTWVPLASKGGYRVVMEHEWWFTPGEAPTLYIPPRVIYYRDRGPAVPLP